MVRPDTGLKDMFFAFVGGRLAVILSIVMRAFVVMFFAAVIYKQFDVFAAIGFFESLAWSAGYDLVRALIPGRKDES